MTTTKQIKLSSENIETTVCLWCFKRHKEGTKVKQKHDRILQRIKQGHVPCTLGECRPYLCRIYEKILRIGMKQLDVNCNELLAEINRTHSFLERLHREV